MNEAPNGPGRYRDVPIELYHSGPGVSRSTLMRLEGGSPLQCRYYMENGISETPAMRFGSMVDMLVYEPQRFDDHYAVKPKFGRKKADLEAKESWEERNAGRTHVSEAEVEEARALAYTIATAPSVAAIMGDAGAQESLYWMQSNTLCKCRPDGYDEKNGWSFDLKTVYSLSDHVLNKRVVDGGYDVQAAMCRAGIVSNGLPWNGHVVIWALKEKPYDVCLWLLSNSSPWIELGRKRFLRLRRKYQQCVDAQHWPGFSNDIIEPRPPQWVVRKLDDEDETERLAERG